MKKRYLFLSLGVLVICLVSLMVYKNRQLARGAISQELSARTQEFINNERISEDKTQTTVSQKLDLTGEKSQIAITSVETPCFKFTSTPHMSNLKVSDSQMCSVSAKLLEPRGFLTVSATHSALPLTEQSGVVMRQKFPDKYQSLELEKSEIISAFPETLAFTSDQEMTAFFKKEDQVVIVALTQILDASQLNSTTITEIVKQVEWQPNFME